MKDKALRLSLFKYALTSARHWYIVPDLATPMPDRAKKRFNHFKDAWEYAKSIAYTRNIVVHD